MPKVCQNMPEKCILCTFMCAVQNIWWSVWETGRLSMYPRNLQIIQESWHRCIPCFFPYPPLHYIHPSPLPQGRVCLWKVPIHPGIHVHTIASLHKLWISHVKKNWKSWQKQIRRPQRQGENAPAVTSTSGMSKTITNSKMADASSDILFDSVRFVLSNWTVIQLAVEHGFGGRDTAEKAEWMVNVINQVLRENGQYSYFWSFSNRSRVLYLFTTVPVEPWNVLPI